MSRADECCRFAVAMQHDSASSFGRVQVKAIPVEVIDHRLKEGVRRVLNDEEINELVPGDAALLPQTSQAPERDRVETRLSQRSASDVLRFQAGFGV